LRQHRNRLRADIKVARDAKGSGHGIGGTARQRDKVKRQALERAGVHYVEIPEGTTPDKMQQIIRQLLTDAAPAA
jgi:hypothetical protein